MTAQQSLAAGAAALAAGRWEDARTSFDDAVATGETAEGHFGLAAALWWLGENHASVSHCTRAYPLFRRSGDVAGAVQCALWLGIVYKANFANFVAANGWIGRADRLLEALDQGPLHAQSWVARAYRMPDLRTAEELTHRALGVARAADDVDLELTALSQLGLIRVGKGQRTAGFALIDEAMAARSGRAPRAPGGSPRPLGRRAHRRRLARRCHRGGGSAERDRRHRERRAADGDGGRGERSGVDRLR